VRGAVHLLRVERGDERALALELARALATAWGLAQVWVPTHRGIATNRGPVRQALEARGDPVEAVATVVFSHAPYRYTFDEVWVV